MLSEMHRLPGENTTHPSFEEVFAYIRLGHKYQMTPLYERTMTYLKTHFRGPLLHSYSQHLDFSHG